MRLNCGLLMRGWGALSLSEVEAVVFQGGLGGVVFQGGLRLLSF